MKRTHHSPLRHSTSKCNPVPTIIDKIPFATAVIAFLFVCGAVYLLAYWATFEVDTFALITIYDIPKSFVWPLFATQGFFIFNLVIGKQMYIIHSNSDPSQIVELKKEWPRYKRRLSRILGNAHFLLLIGIFTAMCIFDDFPNNYMWWHVVAVLASYYTIMTGMNWDYLKRIVPKDKIRLYFIHIGFVLPILSFGTGKVNALMILNNIKYSTVEKIKDNQTIEGIRQYKLLGFTGNHFVYSTLNNDQIFIFNMNEFDGVKLVRIDRERRVKLPLVN